MLLEERVKVVTEDDLSLLTAQTPLEYIVCSFFSFCCFRSGFGVEVEVKMMSDDFGGLFFWG